MLVDRRSRIQIRSLRIRIREAPKKLTEPDPEHTASYTTFYLSCTDVDCESLENFEALMCLDNLASLNESVRARILKDSNFIQVITATVCGDANFVIADMT